MTTVIRWNAYNLLQEIKIYMSSSMKYQLIQNLYEFEQDYYSKLDGKIINEVDIKQLFLNIDRIYLQDFYPQLEHEFTHSDRKTLSIGNLYRNFLNYIQNYVHYMDMYNQSKRHLLTLKLTENKFTTFLQSKKHLPPLEDLLALPFVHIPKLERFFRQLIKITPITSSEFSSLSFIYYKIKPISEFLENCAGNNTHTAELVEISERLTPKVNLIEAGRSFIREGPLIKHCRNSHKKYYFFLFTDILLYCKPTYTISDFTLQMEDDPGIPTLRIFGIEKSFRLEFPTLENKMEWGDSILKCIQYLQTTQSETINKPFSPMFDLKSEFSSCHECNKPFRSFIRSKFYCFGCGHIFCQDCLEKNVVLSNTNKPKVYPYLCSSCKVILSRKQMRTKRGSMQVQSKAHETVNIDQFKPLSVFNMTDEHNNNNNNNQNQNNQHQDMYYRLKVLPTKIKPKRIHKKICRSYNKYDNLDNLDNINNIPNKNRQNSSKENNKNNNNNSGAFSPADLHLLSMHSSSFSLVNSDEEPLTPVKKPRVAGYRQSSTSSINAINNNNNQQQQQQLYVRPPSIVASAPTLPLPSSSSQSLNALPQSQSLQVPVSPTESTTSAFSTTSASAKYRSKRNSISSNNHHHHHHHHENNNNNNNNTQLQPPSLVSSSPSPLPQQLSQTLPLSTNNNININSSNLSQSGRFRSDSNASSHSSDVMTYGSMGLIMEKFKPNLLFDPMSKIKCRIPYQTITIKSSSHHNNNNPNGSSNSLNNNNNNSIESKLKSTNYLRRTSLFNSAEMIGQSPFSITATPPLLSPRGGFGGNNNDSIQFKDRVNSFAVGKTVTKEEYEALNAFQRRTVSSVQDINESFSMPISDVSGRPPSISYIPRLSSSGSNYMLPPTAQLITTDYNLSKSNPPKVPNKKRRTKSRIVN